VRTAHGLNCVSATHAATQRYAYAKIRYVSVRTYPSKIQYIRYISSSLDGSPPPGRRPRCGPVPKLLWADLLLSVYSRHQGGIPRKVLNSAPRKKVSNCVRLFRLDFLLQVYRCRSEWKTTKI